MLDVPGSVEGPALVVIPDWLPPLQRPSSLPFLFLHAAVSLGAFCIKRGNHLHVHHFREQHA